MMNSEMEAWRDEANQVALLDVALKYGANLKRSGQEFIGACPACGGVDRLAVHPTRGVWNCRGACGGADAIALARHLGNLTFKQACEELTGRPSPDHTASIESHAEKEFRAKRRAENDAARKAREAQQKADEENTTKAALSIWEASRPLKGSLAEVYLNSRGIEMERWPEVLRFHPMLRHPNFGPRLPALICRVDDVEGKFTGIWRIYLDEEGHKARLINPKLGLGPCAGGAVRLWPAERKIAVAEGLETALSYWLLIGRKYPVWPVLSTSGMVNFQIPFEVDLLEIACDGDAPLRKHNGEFKPSIPAGRKAAESLRTRALEEGVGCVIASEPPPGLDWNDLWLERTKEIA